MPTPLLKTDPKYGYFSRWPEDGDAWLHPDDAKLARTLVPSLRVFRRDGASGEYSLLHYGDIVLRAKPALWQEVAAPAFEIGEWVEVVTRGLENTPYTGTIREIVWDDYARELRYQIRVGDKAIEDRYAREDLQRVEPTNLDAEVGAE